LKIAKFSRILDDSSPHKVYHMSLQLAIGPLEKRYYDRVASFLREKLGNPAYEFAFAEGQKMSLDDALELNLRTVEEM